MQLGEVMSRCTVKVPMADWKSFICLRFGSGFTSTSSLSNASRLEKRQIELIKWWRKIKPKQGTVYWFLYIMVDKKWDTEQW